MSEANYSAPTNSTSGDSAYGGSAPRERAGRGLAAAWLALPITAAGIVVLAALGFPGLFALALVGPVAIGLYRWGAGAAPTGGRRWALVGIGLIIVAIDLGVSAVAGHYNQSIIPIKNGLGALQMPLFWDTFTRRFTDSPLGDATLDLVFAAALGIVGLAAAFSNNFKGAAANRMTAASGANSQPTHPALREQAAYSESSPASGAPAVSSTDDTRSWITPESAAPPALKPGQVMLNGEAVNLSDEPPTPR